MDSGDDDKDDDKDDKPVGENILFIGILDVFGFENFYINSLEQFCINFTNEKLQQFFNYHIIMSEQEEYIKESVFWKPLSIPDNMECIEMIENAKNGFFTLLDSACAAPKPDPIAFIQELFKNHDKNKTIHKATQPGSGNARGAPKVKAGKKGPRDKFDGFMIDHFADHVTYDASNFLVKNMEAVHPDTAKMLSASKTAMIQQLAEEKGKAKKKLTVTGTFHKGIKTLMKNLKETEPFFVRCVNPNMVKSAKIWDEKVVEHQLRCGGLVEALKVLKLGYPTRVPYSTLYDSYHHTVTNPLIKNMGPEAFSTALLIAFDVAEEDYELGLTKIFFKPSKAAVLDTIMAQAGRPLTSEQSEKITKWVVQKRLKQMIGICKSFLELRKRVRLARASQRWKYIGRVTSFVAFSVVRHLKKARQIILERKRNAAAKQIQSFFRGTYETSRYRNFITKVKKATKSIWISYRRWNERILLKQWLEVKVAETRKRKEEEHRKMMEDETRRKAEEERLAKERKRIEEEEELRRKVREEQEKKRLEEEKRKQEEEEREKLAAIKRQEQASLTNAAAKQEAERLQREQDKKKRENSITMHVKKEQKIEDKRKQDREEKKMRKQFPELYQDEEDEDGDNQNQDDDDDDEEEEESDKKNKKKKPVKKANKKANKKTNNKKTSKKEKEKKKVEKKKKVQKKKRDEDNDGDGGDDNGDDNKEDVDNNVKKQKDNNNNEENASGKEENEEEQQEEEEEEEEDDDDNDDDENENSDGDDSDDSEKPPQQTLQQQLKQFPKIAATGQLFLKYTGKKRRKPQDRIVKVSFDSQGVAKQISWGSGSRHIDFSDILYIAHGHWTPVFISRKDQLDADLCFSVVGKTQILDVQASTKQLAELWVKGLRRLIGQTDADALKLAKQNMENGNLPGSNNPAKKEVDAVKDHKKRTKSLILLQQDLFVMTTTTVFRNLEEERIWEIDQSVRDRFNAKLLYEEALRQDIPWRQWNHWIREKIVTYLRENNRVAHQGSNVIVNPLFNGDFTSPITAPIIPSNYIAPQQQNIIMPQSIPIVPRQSNAQNNVPSGLKGAQPQDENCTLM